MNKKNICVLLATAIMAGGSACSFASSEDKSAGNGISVLYDGEEITFDVEPINEDGTVLVPMRAIFEAFGTKVKWDGDTQTVSARKKSKTYTMTIGEGEITETKDEEVIETVTAEQVMRIVDGRTMIPLRALGEILDLDVEWDGDSQTVMITTPESETDDSWKENTGTIDLDSMSATGNGVEISGKVITITEGGDLAVTGSNEDAQIVVDTEDKVKLRLDGVELANKDGAAIYVKNADKCYITLNEGTVNTLTDGGEYSEESETNACIYSKDDLEIKGKGKLVINGNVHNGITVKDSLEIANGEISVASVADGIHVNDTAVISGGTITVTSGEDGIQSESILDISGGDIDITCTGEVTASAGDMMWRRNAEIVTTTDDEEDVSSKGLKAEWLMDISGGTVTVTANDTCIKCDSEIDINGGELTLTSNVKKGIKGMEDVYINDGVIDIKKSTEGIESKHTLTVNGGDISVIASDDGFNAGGNGTDNGFGGMMGDPSQMQGQNGGMRFRGQEMQNGEQGDMSEGGMQGRMGGMMPQEMQTGEQGDMSESGMQGQMGRMMPPEMQIGEQDDMSESGMQGQMGRMMPQEMQNGEQGDITESGMQGRMGGMMPQEMQNGETGNTTDMRRGFGGRVESTEVSKEHHIQINGGNIYINSDGDGIDSNGSIIIDGGYVVVDGPEGSGDGAIDHDGLCQVNGGTLIAVGSSGMIENPAESSGQNIISAYASISKGDVISIKDQNGKVVLSYTANKNAGHLMYSSDAIADGETYTVYVNDNEQASAEITNKLNVVGTNTGGFGGRGMSNRTVGTETVPSE